MPHRFALIALIALLMLSGCAPEAQGAEGIERGRALLAQYQCGTCHTIPGVASAGGTVAQTLKGWKHRSYIAGRLPNNADVLARWIVEPKALVPGTAMPSMGVSPDDARLMAAYLRSLE